MAEILAPAGSYEALEAAVKAGCDAVYLGGSRFSARSYAANFDADTLKKGIEYAHLYDVSVYYALNTMIKEKEFQLAVEDLDEAYLAGVDAVIVQDLGLASLVKDRYPDLELHGSTQLSVHSLDGVMMMASLGFDRIVVGRELSLEEIREIKEKTQIELEVFVHGALCYAYSGKCLMSSYIGGRSGNRGTCAQTCRLPYTISDGEKETAKAYWLSPKDIMSLGLLPEILDIGIDSLKIEGRMKSPHYVAKVVSLYRKYMTMAEMGQHVHVLEEDMDDLLQLFNRGGFTDGYLKPHGQSMISGQKPNHQGLLVGRLLGYNKKRKAYQVVFEKAITKGDTLVVNHGDERSFQVDQSYEKGRGYLYIRGNALPEGTQVYRISDQSLLQDIESQILSVDPRIRIQGYIEALIGSPLKLTVIKDQHVVTVTGDVVEAANKQPVDKAWLEEQVSKTGGTPYDFGLIEVVLGQGAFVLQKSIKGLRREALEVLTGLLSRPHPIRSLEPYVRQDFISQDAKVEEKNLTVLLRNSRQFETIKGYAIDRVFLDMNFMTPEEINQVLGNRADIKGDIYVKIPDIQRKAYRKRIEKDLSTLNIEAIDGFVVGTYDGLYRVKDFNKSLILDDSILIYNNAMITWAQSLGVAAFCLAKELRPNELKGMHLSGAIMNLYGSQVVMTSAQCGYKEAFSCQYDPKFYVYKDRMGNEMKAFKQCRYCTNYIFNAHKTYLLDKQDLYREQGACGFRIDLTDEDNDTIQQIMNAYRHQLSPEEIDFQAYTRGHFKKGVR